MLQTTQSNKPDRQWACWSLLAEKPALVRVSASRRDLARDLAAFHLGVSFDEVEALPEEDTEP